MRQQARTGSFYHQYTHDAWGRVVKVDVAASGSPSTWTTIQQNEYNAMHWRTVRRSDTTPTHNGLDQERRLYYSAAWQLLHEDIADGYTVSATADRNAVQFWGRRYIDDAVGRRVYIPPGGIGSGTTSWYFYATDVQFSVNAVVRGPGTGAGRLVERIGYDAYGLARHHYHDDVDGDGDTDSTDSGIVAAALGTSIGGAGYNADADIDRDGDVDSGDSALVATGKAALASGLMSVSSSSGVDNPVGYVGYLFDSEVVLNQARYRTYDSSCGRWISRDPAGYMDGANLYEYVRSCPVTRLDPFGLDDKHDSGDPFKNDPFMKIVERGEKCGGLKGYWELGQGENYFAEWLSKRMNYAKCIYECLKENPDFIVKASGDILWDYLQENVEQVGGLLSMFAFVDISLGDNGELDVDLDNFEALETALRCPEFAAKFAKKLASGNLKAWGGTLDGASGALKQLVDSGGYADEEAKKYKKIIDDVRKKHGIALKRRDFFEKVAGVLDDAVGPFIKKGVKAYEITELGLKIMKGVAKLCGPKCDEKCK
jgi:RHS repeat-associated protein